MIFFFMQNNMEINVKRWIQIQYVLQIEYRWSFKMIFFIPLSFSPSIHHSHTTTCTAFSSSLPPFILSIHLLIPPPPSICIIMFFSFCSFAIYTELWLILHNIYIYIPVYVCVNVSSYYDKINGCDFYSSFVS